MDSAPTISAFDTVSANLRMVMRGLLATMGAWRVEPVILVALYHRISRTMGQIERMLVRFQAGALMRMPQRGAVLRPRAGGAPSMIMPRKFGWLVQAGRHHAAGIGLHLQAVLTTPEMVALLEASAQARRILRPLCRALALEVPGVSSSACAAPHERKPRVRKPRPKPEPFRIPFPRGLLSAARRQGFGKMC